MATRGEVEMEDNEEVSIGGYESDPNQVTRGVSNGIIEKLKRKSYSVGKVDGCSICLEELDGKYKLMEIPYSHLFHSRCVVKWLERNNSCPLCRGKLQVQDSE
ncbi:hypothetical protein EUGRSUZ_C02349 [Eucalyptus grandis]|uniref:Uncharacterized protein n=2 Tax=Eucalyptus grandis TaxID=71139 RepID=A0ACC3LFI3_EUCGR|nr:hypothetical protein EUGRSUZ_C02349 [Eucalyptus grandis]